MGRYIRHEINTLHIYGNILSQDYNFQYLNPFLHMLRQGKMKHNKEQFEYPKSIVIPHCEGVPLPITIGYP